mgnify:CR=1 FL=1
MPKSFDLATASEEELRSELHRIGEAKAEAENGFRDQQLVIQDELSKRARRRRLESLTSEERAELVAMASEEDSNG